MAPCDGSASRASLAQRRPKGDAKGAQYSALHQIGPGPHIRNCQPPRTRTVDANAKGAGVAISVATDSNKAYEKKDCVFGFAVIYHGLISTNRILGKAERGQRGLLRKRVEFIMFVWVGGSCGGRDG
jgi:hypothetical protein